MKKLLGLGAMAIVAFSLSSCRCHQDAACDPCLPKAQYCEPKVCSPKPLCAPKCETKYYDAPSAY